VSEGALTSTPGKFIPLWLRSAPPCRTCATTRLFHVHHHELQQSVVDENAIADVEIFGEAIVRDGDLGRFGGRLGSQDNFGAALEWERSREVADANARPL